MKAQDAAWKIIRLGGTPDMLSLERYGVSEQEARKYVDWWRSKKSRNFRKSIYKRFDGKPILFYGMNTCR